MKKLAILFAALIGPPLAWAEEVFIEDVSVHSAAHDFAEYEQRVLNLERELDAIRYGGAGCEESSGEERSGCTCNCCCPGWFASADYLNWNVERDDLAFAIPDPAGLGVPSSGQSVLELDPRQDAGFRLGLGRRTMEGWELGVKYTHFDSSGRRTYVPGGSQVLAVLSSPSTGLTNADAAVATSQLEYDVFDFEAGRWFDVSDRLSLLALGGVRFTSIDHLLQARYNGGAFINGLVDVPTNLDAFGGRLGGAMHWNLSSRLSLFGNTALSVNSTEITAGRREVNAGAITINSSRTTNPVAPATEVAVGARYLAGGMSVAVGYEWTNWFNVVTPLEFSDSFNGGTINASQRDLGLHGLFVNASFAF